jgi:pimeloyl-ACP methyl ester carboxylesterase
MNESKYREAERRLWASTGLEPEERFVRLPRIGSTVRVQEVGAGAPALFIHGGPNAGSTWAPLVEHVDGLRCLIVDRPGTGLSEPHPVTAATLPQFGADFVGDVLDALEIQSAHVVASSFGGHLALRSAATEPHRFQRMVQMAAPAAVPGQVIPPFMKVLRYGFPRAIINMLPPSRRANDSILRQIGHGASLDAGLISDLFKDWYLELGRHTDTLENDGALIGQEFIPHLDEITLGPDLLGSVKVPTLFLWGEDDTFGGADNARAVTGLLPDSRLVLLPRSGHLPWIDDPKTVGESTTAFLVGSHSSDHPAPAEM